MSAAPGSRTRLGALLLRKGLVSPVELEGALEAQRRKGGLLGEILVRSGLASRPAIEDALAEQAGGLVDAEAGFGTGLRSQIASRRPLRAMPNPRPVAPAPVHAVAFAAAPRPVLEAVPDPDETDAPETHDLAAELLQQVTRWQRLAGELREERDALRQLLAVAERARAELRSELEARTSKPVLPTAHVVLVRVGARYELVPQDGPPPQPGDRLELDDQRRYVVLKVGASPLPGDDRRCAFAEPAS